MAKYDVAEIKKEAEDTMANYKGHRGDSKTRYPMEIRHLRTYCRKALFLCKEIAKLQKKLQRRKG